MLALYMPIIRDKAYGYLNVWNVHPIQKQNNRLTVVDGKPVVNHYSSKDHIRIHGRTPSHIILGQFMDEFLEWGEFFTELATPHLGQKPSGGVGPSNKAITNSFSNIDKYLPNKTLD